MWSRHCIYGRLRLYVVGGGTEFDWDAENVCHLERHDVTPSEFEELMKGDPLHLEYQAAEDEERYKVLGASRAGRVLIAVWMPRAGNVRAITAHGAGRSYRRLYRENRA